MISVKEKEKDDRCIIIEDELFTRYFDHHDIQDKVENMIKSIDMIKSIENMIKSIFELSKNCL